MLLKVHNFVIENQKKKYTSYQDSPQNAQFISNELKSNLLIGSDLFVGLGNFDFYNSKKEFLKNLKANSNPEGGYYEE